MSPDDDAEDLDLRAHYRSPPPLSPQFAAAGAAVRRPHGTWHPGWGIAGSVVVVFGLLVFTDYSNLDNSATMDEEDVVAQSEAPDDSLSQPPVLGSHAAAPPPALPASLTTPQNGSPIRLRAVPPPAGPDGTSRIEYIRNLLRGNQREAALVQLAALHRDEDDLELPPDLQALLAEAETLPEPDHTEAGVTASKPAH
ncbi:hypothetical protein [Bordetella holmesii]|nr:hypothetical protein [Bordetella holmesii]AMD46363.1 hypothetical protein H558_13130 [Bordetella holmesii H558]AMD50515.1 hypothetical protein F783_004935 [Bordetella holmesii F627]AOB35257.1 hypothetical protein BBB42_06900 [Bordetella holmesii]AUL19244.1 hypothetical protein BTL46_06895 [Bordetella holmesii]AUL22579.1 hypothetical protein BTL48_06985 [Bordetella holmesii]